MILAFLITWNILGQFRGMESCDATEQGIAPVQWVYAENETTRVIVQYSLRLKSHTPWGVQRLTDIKTNSNQNNFTTTFILFISHFKMIVLTFQKMFSAQTFAQTFSTSLSSPVTAVK